ncbi:MAG TPA: winged helix DNA-binding domain-containing protein [Candidatus Saccharimonadales bacterium]|nr:winged helix DNA-binding domain-containing protein [Candidatus Saccharimonadales bacterium]
MVPQDVPFRRLQSLQITDHRFATPGELVTWMGAVQAQDYASAKWALGVRLPGLTDVDLENAIAQKQIVRTWPMRGTLHFVPAKDAKWMLQLMATKIIQADATRRKQLEITDDQLAKAMQIMTAALKNNICLKRADLLRALDDNGVSTANQRGYHLLAYAAWSGLICLGPMDGKQQTFVLLDEWVPGSIQLSHQDALTEIAVRFAQSHGPVTAHDLARWTKLSLAEVRLGLQSAGDRLKAVEINGAEYWTQPHAPALTEAAHGTYLLPAFDEFVIGYKDRSAVLHADHEIKIVPGSNGVFLPMVVADGQVIGVWKRKLTKKVAIEVLLFKAPTAAQERAITEAAQHFAAFVNLPLAPLVWTRLHY